MPTLSHDNCFFYCCTKKHCIPYVAFLAIFIFTVPCRAARINLPKDAQGWTIFTPSADSRIVYISESGNDSTCRAYLKNDAAIGNNPFVPAGAIATCKTLAKTLTLTRDGYPDWILFKRGGVYRQSIAQNSIHSGRSATEPFLIAGYGASGVVPSLRPVAGDYFWQTGYGSTSYVVFANMEWYADTVDPAAPAYIGAMTDKSTTLRMYTNSGYQKQGLMWEGLRFRKIAFNLQTANIFAIDGMTFRRNVMLDLNAGAGAIQGKLTNSLFEENIWDHNGWYDATYPGYSDKIRDHNIYINFGVNSILRKNISSRASSMGFKLTAGDSHALDVDNLLVDDNLLFDNNIGMAIGSNHGNIKYRIKNSTFSNNVFSHGGVTNVNTQGIWWMMHFDGFDHVSITHNLDINSNPATSNYFTFSFYPGTGSGLPGVWSAKPYACRNVTISDNIIRKANNAGVHIGEVIDFRGEFQLDNFNINNNIFDYQSVDSGTITFFYYSGNDNLGYGVNQNNVTWTANTYYDSSRSFTFLWPNYQGPALTQSQWKEQVDSAAKFTAPSYPDATRSIETYMAHLGEPATEEAFLAKIRAQNRYHWDPNYTAPVINAWLRAGYYGSGLNNPLIPPGVQVQ